MKYNSYTQQQGVNWVVRKAIGISTVTLKLRQYWEPGPETSTPIAKIEVTQSTSSGLPGTTEKRTLDWSETPQEDHIFGACLVQTRWIRGSKSADGKVRPNIDLQTKAADESVVRFLRGEIFDGSDSEGFVVENPTGAEIGKGEGEGLWVQLFIRSKNNGWSAEQVYMAFALGSRNEILLFKC